MTKNEKGGLALMILMSPGIRAESFIVFLTSALIFCYGAHRFASDEK